MNARQMLVQDLNGDGKMMVFFIQHLPDYKPFERHENNHASTKLKLCQEIKIMVHQQVMLNKSHTYFTMEYKSRVYAYINNGKGSLRLNI